MLPVEDLEAEDEKAAHNADGGGGGGGSKHRRRHRRHARRERAGSVVSFRNVIGVEQLQELRKEFVGRSYNEKEFVEKHLLIYSSILHYQERVYICNCHIGSFFPGQHFHSGVHKQDFYQLEVTLSDEGCWVLF